MILLNKSTFVSISNPCKVLRAFQEMKRMQHEYLLFSPGLAEKSGKGSGAPNLPASRPASTTSRTAVWSRYAWLCNVMFFRIYFSPGEHKCCLQPMYLYQVPFTALQLDGLNKPSSGICVSMYGLAYALLLTSEGFVTLQIMQVKHGPLPNHNATSLMFLIFVQRSAYK